jgi:Heterokaryon incompatibility protein (HET)
VQFHQFNHVLVLEPVIVAFSHVWADGLGSRTEHGLPACQIRRLSSLASKLVPTSAFWIDSLCIPGAKEPRAQAIRLMVSTYDEAAAVLVLDSGFQSCLSDTSTEEKLLRLLTSSWMRRLWTLQGALAAQLVFQFQDMPISLGQLLPSAMDLMGSTLLTGLRW